MRGGEGARDGDAPERFFYHYRMLNPGRNDPCPCGSGKKYKKCCGLLGLAPAQGAGPAAVGAPDRPHVGAGSLPGGPPAGFRSLFPDEFTLRRYRDFVDSLPEDAEAPSLMEFLGRPNAATEASRGLREAAQGREFSSMEEAQAFFDLQMARQNEAPRPDFMGLSSAQMRRILNAESLADLDQLFTLSDEPLPAEAAEARLPAMVRYLIDRHVQSPKGLQLTSSGYYKPDVVRAFADRFYEGDPDYLLYIRIEADCIELGLVHDYLLNRGYTEENSVRSRVSAEGAAIVQDPDRLWRDLLSFMLFDADWRDYASRYTEFDHQELVQSSAPFSLLLLKAGGPGRRTVESLYHGFARAFPLYDPYYADDPDAMGSHFRSFYYEAAFLRLFCSNLGLVRHEPAPASPSPDELDRASSPTPLFDRALIWRRP